MLSSKPRSGETVNGFSAWTYPISDEQELLFRLHCPETEKDKTYPLVVHFHGMGSRGNDNQQFGVRPPNFNLGSDQFGVRPHKQLLLSKKM